MGCLTVTFERVSGMDATFDKKGGMDATFEKNGGMDAWFSKICDVPSMKPRLYDAEGRLVKTSENETIILNEE